MRHLNAPLPAWKRSLDLLFCAAVFPVFTLVTLFMAVMVRLTSPGPVLFKQERIGLGGRRFKIYKFRTMHVAADTRSHQQHFTALMSSNAPMQKLDATGDSRLIAGAWLIRATGLDELPQIINVLRGEMSVVGPRPCIPYEYEHFTSEQRRRCESVPGLTGLWQVSGKNRTTVGEMLELDCEYGRRRSLWLDVSILGRTPGTLLGQVCDQMIRRYRPSRASSFNPPAKATSHPALGATETARFNLGR
jgi:lipopolysaccharide/colanic/teichoic acid biosynthesis glycosyltransferase